MTTLSSKSNKALSGDKATDTSPLPGVVNLADARIRSRGRAGAHVSLADELNAARLLIDQGLLTQAGAQLTSLIKVARHDARLLAEARVALSTALQLQTRHRESLEAVAMYESPPLRRELDQEVAIAVRVRIGLGYNYTGDYPKAIALLDTTLREDGENGSDASLGAIYTALSRVYRSINESPIARDYAHKALEHFRRAGDWRGLADAYFGIGNTYLQEGNYEASLENYEQALKLIGDYHAATLLGQIYSNMAAACWHLRRPRDGVRYLEQAIQHYERTELKGDAVNAYNNLGLNLVLIGEWSRAQEVFERAIAIANEVGLNNFSMASLLDSFGELLMLRGDLDEALNHLERAVKLHTESGNKWYAGQNLRTLSRCYLAMNDPGRALSAAQQALERTERISDRQGICESHMLLAEARLKGGALDECEVELRKVADDTANSVSDLAIAGEAQRIHGLLALKRGDAALAAHHYGRSASIFELLGDRYRQALAHAGLGQAYTIFQPERAGEYLVRAASAFREFGARLDLARTEEALAKLNFSHVAERNEPSTLAQLLTLRLAEAVASRELLLREFVAVLHQETDACRIMIVEANEDETIKIAAAHGVTNADSTSLANELYKARTAATREQLESKHNATVLTLRPTSAAPAMLFIEPRSPATLRGSALMQTLLRVVELGMDVCALRLCVRASPTEAGHATLAGTSLLPGFIHSSPAMTRLVEEVHRIRSSDVTVLITGESGTGKELVARAIHVLSARRAKIFVPFNCTAVPKELSEGYLFGYRKGAFTGAVADSPGVIRAAADGTLFLDEIGDLPLDVQPKLLRFLQEGEIQPLGEQRPMKVDVRIVAATNSNLEEMVQENRFREDLYYRLNVIRLRVPPLRERRAEIPAIVNYYLNHYSTKFGRTDLEITPQSLDLLMVSDWPGNVRQLCNEVQRLVARAEDGQVITPDHLSPELRRTATPPPARAASPASVTPIASTIHDTAASGMTLSEALGELERRMIEEALRKHSGNISRAARELGLTRRGLYLKLERYQSASA